MWACAPGERPATLSDRGTAAIMRISGIVLGSVAAGWCAAAAVAAGQPARKPAIPVTAPKPAPPAGAPAAPAIPPEAAEFFETHVRPVLAEKCYTCHGPKIQQAGLRLDS